MPVSPTARALRSALPVVLLAVACTRAPSTPAPAPEDTPDTVPRLAPANGPAIPPIPLAEGALAPRVQYPEAGALLAARDSNFIFGSVGNGRAALSINGYTVEVHPNGAFLAFLPVPSAGAPQYELEATLGADTVHTVHPVRVLPPRPVLADSGALVVDEESIAPRGSIALPPDERIRVSVRAPANAQVWVQGTANRRKALVTGSQPPTWVMRPRAARAAQTAAGDALGVATSIVGPDSSILSPVPDRYLRDPHHWSAEVPVRWLADSLGLLVARGADTLRFPLALADTLGPQGLGWAMLGADTTMAPSDTDRTVYGRPVPAGTYKWFFLPGTVVRATGARDGFVRVRLDDELDVWVASADVRFFPDGYAAPRRVVPNLRVIPSDAWVDVRFPVGDRPPFQVQVEERALVLTLYGTTANTDIIQFVANDSLVTHITWEQETADRARYTLHLSEPPYGWLAMWDGGSFVLRVRRPPPVDPVRPLAGLRIVVDAGHPPAGATGPTGLYEAVPVLAIAHRLQRILTERGAIAIMTRSTEDTLGLADRPIMSRRVDAHAFVSIHLNALPDGVNPFTAHGTGTYYFHPPSVPLAREVQRGMVHWMGLRDLGVYYDNLAVVRQTWMPSVLCEGAFIMMPEQEHAVRTAEFQERYALGVADGLERYFRGLREEMRPGLRASDATEGP